MAVKLLTYDVYRTGMSLFKELADETYQDKEHLPQYYLRKVAQAEVPTGYDSAYRLIMNIAGDPNNYVKGDTLGIMGASGGGVIQTYIVGSTPYASDWLSDVDGGPALIPSKEFLYVILTPGNELNSFYRYDETTSTYIKVIDGAGAGAIFSYTVAGKTPLDSDWLSDTSGGAPIVPKKGPLYLVLTPGKYYNNFYRYDPVTSKYVVVIDANDHDVMFVYEVAGKTPFDSDWLSETASGASLTPVAGKLYIDITPNSKYEDYTFRFDTTTNKYIMTSGGAGGAQIVYTIAGKTAYASDWLTDTAATSPAPTPITPEEGVLYLILSTGAYYSNIVRFDATGNKYELVVNARVVELTKLEYLALSNAKKNDGTIYLITDSAPSAPDVDDYLPSIINIPSSPQPGMIILWKGTVGGDFTVSPAVYRYNGSHWEQEDLGIEGQTIQVDTMPMADATTLGKIYQYIGVSTGSFMHGYFYECKQSGAAYFWEAADVQAGGRVITKAAFAALSQAEKDNGTVYYIYDDNPLTEDSVKFQFYNMPTASATLEGKVYQYVGPTQNSFMHNYFYECKQVSGVYFWEATDVQSGGRVINKADFDLLPQSEKDNGIVYYIPDAGVPGSGESIQVEELPIASSLLEGKVYQYIGTSTVNYTHNYYFYECAYQSGSYIWVNTKVQPGEKTQFDTMPTASIDWSGKVIQFIGVTDSNYTHNYFYECVYQSGAYSWKNVKVQDGEKIQVNSLPSPTVDLEGVIYQYTGESVNGKINGYFYQCVESSTPGTYIWVAKDVQLGGHQIKSGNTSYVARTGLNFIDFDITDDSTNDETEVRPHLLSSAEFTEIFDTLPASHNGGLVLDQRGNERVVGTFVTSLGVSKNIYEKWVELTVPVATVTSLTALVESIGSTVDQFIDVRGFVVTNGWYSNIIWGAPNMNLNGVMLAAFDNTATTNKNSVGIFYNGDVTGFDRIYVIARYTKTVD